MSRKVVARSAFVVGIILSLLTACSRVRETPGNPTPQLLSGKAQGWTGGNAVVKASAYDGTDSGKLFLAEGSVAGDGAFEVTLPVLEATSKALHPSDQFFSCDAGQKGVVDSSLGTLEVALLADPEVFTAAGDPEGEMFRSGLEGDTYIRVEKLYAAVDGTVQGTCTYSGAALTETITFDLTLNAGWNDIVRLGTSSPGRGVDLVRTGDVPTGVEWMYSKYVPPPESPR